MENCRKCIFYNEDLDDNLPVDALSDEEMKQYEDSESIHSCFKYYAIPSKIANDLEKCGYFLTLKG